MWALVGLAARVGTLALKQGMAAGGAAGGALKTAFYGSDQIVQKDPLDPSKGHKTVHVPGPISHALNIGWQLDALSNFASSYLPSTAIVCEVNVYGSPFSTKKDLYYLALSLAFGVINFEMVSTSDWTMEVMIDHTGKHVRAKLTQSYAGFLDNFRSLGNEGSGNAIIRDPPADNLIAGTWPRFLQTENKQEQNFFNYELPKLGTVIISPTKADNYEPRLDNGSVETNLGNLICAALLRTGCSPPIVNTLQDQIENNTKVAPVIR